MKKTKSFKHWTSEEVERTFGIHRLRGGQLLNEWLKNNLTEIKPDKINFLKEIREELIERIDFWNEEELKYNFLGKFVNSIHFEVYALYRSYLGRQLSAEVNDLFISGEVDFMVAMGKQNPFHPFFFLHEYKQELKHDNDPLGQLLIAMVAAQARNQNEFPIYGCYIVGRFWFFVILKDSEYSVSNAYNVTDDDIFDVYQILQKTKENIEYQIKFLNLS